MVFNTGPYTDLPDNSILITANMQSETGFPSSHQLKPYVASKSRLKLAARAVLSADSGLLVVGNVSSVMEWISQENLLLILYFKYGMFLEMCTYAVFIFK